MRTPNRRHQDARLTTVNETLLADIRSALPTSAEEARSAYAVASTLSAYRRPAVSRALNELTDLGEAKVVVMQNRRHYWRTALEEQSDG